MTTASAHGRDPVVARLSTLDWFLPVWILAGTGAGLGPLIEVPVLVALVYVSLWARRFFTAAASPRSVAVDPS